MTNRIKIYRTVSRRGSVISAELVAEIPLDDCLGDLQDLAESYGGDYFITEPEINEFEEALI